MVRKIYCFILSFVSGGHLSSIIILGFKSLMHLKKFKKVKSLNQERFVNLEKKMHLGTHNTCTYFLESS